MVAVVDPDSYYDNASAAAPGPSPEQAERMAEEQRERELAGLTSSLAANCRLLGSPPPKSVAEIESTCRKKSVEQHPEKVRQDRWLKRMLRRPCMRFSKQRTS